MIQPPKNCPSCQSTLERKKDQLYCLNPECGASQFKKVEYFCKTLKIKGLGTASIKKLDLKSIRDIYSLKLEDIVEGLSSEKLGNKLFEEITLSQSKSLNDLLPAFGIPLIGKSATEKLSKVCSSITDITPESCKEAGLGEKSTNNLMEWLINDYPLISNLPFSFKFNTNIVKSPKDIKGVVCISGKLNSFKNKKEAENILIEKGYIVKPSLTKDVTILVNESGIKTSKTVKAEEAGIEIITNLKLYIGD